MFDRLAIIGIGLIGSSIARAAREHGLAKHIAIADASETHRKQAQDLKLGDSVHNDAAEAVALARAWKSPELPIVAMADRIVNPTAEVRIERL